MPTSEGAESPQDGFWRLAAPLLQEPGVAKSTLMGLPCVRYDGTFFASFEPSTNRLVAKLPAERVQYLVAGGDGEPFAPAGRTFREWVAVAPERYQSWDGLLLEALDFARQGGGRKNRTLQ